MDFVESPFGGEGLEVPLVGLTVMDLTDDEWTEYRRRSPFVDATGNLDVARPQQDIAGFIQSWLYFGLLAVLSDTTIDGRNLSIPGKRWSTVISSELVASELTDIKLGVLRLPRDKCMVELERHKTLLVKADEAVRWAERQFTGQPSKLVDLILLSVRVLIGTIAESYDCVCENMFEQLCGTSIQWYRIAKKRGDPLKAADRALQDKMVENGWCVHQIQKILSTFSYQTAYYFARMPRPRSARLSHMACTDSSCKGWDSKPGDTRARHAAETCACPTVSVSSVKVAEIIRSNQIPLVSIEEDATGVLSLKLHTRNSFSKYVAISHVWADGLGNAFENGLPACQLSMLRTHLRKIPGSQSSWIPLKNYSTTPLFWMDTLCIPVQAKPPEAPFSSEDLGDIKRKAIDKMNVVYSSSSHTLVLDDEMRILPVSADDPTKLAYSQCCGWTTRSWTLQEGCLSPSTVFALADGIYFRESKLFGQQFRTRFYNTVRIGHYLVTGKRLITPSLTMTIRGLTPETVARCFDFSVHRDIRNSFSTRFFSIWSTGSDNPMFSSQVPLVVRNKYAKIWNELLDRASSQPADTPAIFANLLGVSAYEVLKRETEQERVALVIRQQNVLPIEMLYNTGPRLREKLHAQAPGDPTIRSRDLEPVLMDTPEEGIGLLDMPEPEAQRFKNGWVPGMIQGDRISQPLRGGLYLQVLERCLKIYENDKERYPYMYTTTAYEIPTSPFVLNAECQRANTRNTRCANYPTIIVTRVMDSSSVLEDVQETVMGHCFIYDPGSMFAMSKGLISHAQGVHLIIVSRDEGRLTTLYSDPIRLTRISKARQHSVALPTVKCECNIHDKKAFVDILYDAEDLGPRLSALSNSPTLVSINYWFSPLLAFLTHQWFTSGLKPFTGTLRPRIISTAWFIIPLIVFLYQKIVVKAAAGRLLLDPLNDRGQLGQPSRSWRTSLRHRADALVTAPWAVNSFGLVLESLFWLALKGSEGTHAAVASKERLLISLVFVSYWYLYMCVDNVRIVTLYYYLTISIFVRGIFYDVVTVGLSAIGMSEYISFLLNVWLIIWSIRKMRKCSKP